VSLRDFFRRPKQEVRRLDGLSVPTWAEVSAGQVGLVEGTEQRALSLVPVFASVRLLAGTVSTLPLKTYRDVDGEKVRAPQARLFADLEKSGRLVPWLHACVTSMAMRGDGLGRIVDRDGYGFPTQIEWLDPTNIRFDYGTPHDPRIGWRLGTSLVPESDMLHIPWFTLPGRKMGLSPIAAFAATINSGIEANKYAADWFRAGGFPTGTFQNTAQTLTREQATEVKARFRQSIAAREPLVYGNDWAYNPVTVPPNEAQFIEAQRLNATQIAAIYGIPPEMIGGETGRSMTYANVEQQQIQFVMMTLRPWLVKLEHAFSAILPDRQYVRFNADALIRADTKTRHEVYEIARRIGSLNLDEIRALEERPSLPNGEGQAFLPAAPTATPAPDEVPDNVRSISWERPA
jgi:HK97 family phage portal protein